MSCHTCLQCINAADLCVECDGKCAKLFHAKCVGLSEDRLDVISHTNVLWMCDNCVKDFFLYRKAERGADKSIQNATRDDTYIEDELAELKSQVAGILDTLSSFSPKKTSSAPHHSTPISSFELLDDTNVDYRCSCTEGHEKYAQTDSNKVFSLLLTNIDCRVTENEISNMVSECLEAPIIACSNVTKLVPKWRKSYDYVSFKVILNERWKVSAMDPTTWPCGVKYREFVQNINVWRPFS